MRDSGVIMYVANAGKFIPELSNKCSHDTK